MALPSSAAVRQCAVRCRRCAAMRSIVRPSSWVSYTWDTSRALAPHTGYMQPSPHSDSDSLGALGDAPPPDDVDIVEPADLAATYRKSVDPKLRTGYGWHDHRVDQLLVSTLSSADALRSPIIVPNASERFVRALAAAGAQTVMATGEWQTPLRKLMQSVANLNDGGEVVSAHQVDFVRSLHNWGRKRDPFGPDMLRRIERKPLALRAPQPGVSECAPVPPATVVLCAAPISRERSITQNVAHDLLSYWAGANDPHSMWHWGNVRLVILCSAVTALTMAGPEATLDKVVRSRSNKLSLFWARVFRVLFNTHLGAKAPLSWFDTQVRSVQQPFKKQLRKAGYCTKSLYVVTVEPRCGPLIGPRRVSNGVDLLKWYYFIRAVASLHRKTALDQYIYDAFGESAACGGDDFELIAERLLITGRTKSQVTHRQVDALFWRFVAHNTVDPMRFQSPNNRYNEEFEKHYFDRVLDKSIR